MKGPSPICGVETDIKNAGVDGGSICDDDTYCVIGQEEPDSFTEWLCLIDSNEIIEKQSENEKYSATGREKICMESELDTCMFDRNNQGNDTIQLHIGEKYTCNSELNETCDDDNIGKSENGENFSKKTKRKCGLDSVHWKPECNEDSSLSSGIECNVDSSSGIECNGDSSSGSECNLDSSLSDQGEDKIFHLSKHSSQNEGKATLR